MNQKLLKNGLIEDTKFFEYNKTVRLSLRENIRQRKHLFLLPNIMRTFSRASSETGPLGENDDLQAL